MIGSVGIFSQSDIAKDQAVSAGSSSNVMQAIKTAAARTGVSFSYLLNKASTESSLDPTAKAGTSSATGLFQFTGQTWLRMVKSVGSQYGLGDMASHITVDGTGTAHADAGWKQQILALRNDPTASAEMAGELDKQNMQSLQQSVGGKIGATDLYMAHFLGASGASDFISAMRSTPNASAATVLPEAASANNSVFYNSDGSARSLTQIYQHFAAKFDGNSAATMVASNAGVATAAGAKTTTVAAASASSAAATNTMQVAANTVPTAASLSAALPGAASAVIGATHANNSSSLFATMVLAQMNMEDRASASLFNTADKQNGEGDKAKANQVVGDLLG